MVEPTLHDFLDCGYGEDGDRLLQRRLGLGAEVNGVDASGERPLHVAARRRRLSAVQILIRFGADVDAINAHGKTAYAHSIRRGFDEIVKVLVDSGANTQLNLADQLAVAVVNGKLEEAARILDEDSFAANTGNPGEDRLLADIAGRYDQENAIEMLIRAGANLSATALDDGTPLHQAAWFGQPANARILIDAGAPLDVFDKTHGSSPIGWAVHGSRYSGGAAERQDVYVELVKMLLDAGSKLEYANESGGRSYLDWLLSEASFEVRETLSAYIDSH